MEFGVYDLKNFLSVLSVHRDNLELEFDDKNVYIIGNNGRSRISYRFCNISMIDAPSDKPLVVNDFDIKFALSEDDYQWIVKVASIIAAPNISIESDGTKIYLSASDCANDSAHTDSLEICAGNGDQYKMIFKTDNLTNILTGNYDVSVTTKGIAHFQNKDTNLQYWISVESGSTFTKGT